MFKKLKIFLMLFFAFLVVVDVYANFETFQIVADRTQAQGINDSGITIGFSVPPDGYLQGFYHQNGIYTLFDDPTFGQPQPFDINNNNIVIGYVSNRTFVFDIDNNSWSYLPYIENKRQFMYGINDYGLMTGLFRNPSVYHSEQAVIFENDVFVTVSYSIFTFGRITDVNNNREAIGYFWSDDGTFKNVLLNINSDLTYDITTLNLPTLQGVTLFQSFALNDAGNVYGILIQDGIEKCFVFNIHTENFNIVFTENDITGYFSNLSIKGSNNLDQIVGSYSDDGTISGRTAFIFTPEIQDITTNYDPIVFKLMIKETGNKFLTTGDFLITSDLNLTDGRQIDVEIIIKYKSLGVNGEDFIIQYNDTHYINSINENRVNIE